MAASKDQIKELLGSGLTAEQTALAIGCEPSYISHLMSNADFSDEIIQLRTAAIQEHNKRDKTINCIEDKLIVRLEEAIDQNLIYKPRDLLTAFQTVNNAKRRGAPNKSAPVTNQQVVILNLPVRVIQKFQISALGEVVQVDDKTLVTMPSSNLLHHLHVNGGSDGSKYAEVSKYLPTTKVPETKFIGDSGE